MKKKLEKAYLPDRDTQKRKAIVGLSGGVHSFVTAYLLKIQKYDLIGVTVLVGADGPIASTLSCQVGPEKLKFIKDFCHTMGIPHVVVDGRGDFREEVIEKWMANKLTGKFPSQCWDCHEVRMKLLYGKARELNIPHVATGHFAKVFRNEGNKTVFVHSSNDEVNDQSAHLSRLPHEILDSLLLPLSDLQEKEVLKLAENFGISENLRAQIFNRCFNDDEPSLEYLESQVPKRYLSKGDIFNNEGSKLSEHTGVHHHTLGDELLVDDSTKEHLKYSKLSFTDRRIYVESADYFSRKRIVLTDCRISEDTPWSGPMKGFAKCTDTQQIECWVYPKNLNSALVELDLPVTLKEGDIMTIYRKKGKNAKVYLSGNIRYIREPLIDEGSPDASTKIDIGRDF